MNRVNMEEITREFLTHQRQWPGGGSMLCMKKGQPLGGNGKCGIIRREQCDALEIVVTNHGGIGAKMYGGPFEERFDSVDALLAAGWVVD